MTYAPAGRRFCDADSHNIETRGAPVKDWLSGRQIISAGA